MEHQPGIPIPESWELKLYKYVVEGKSDGIREFDLRPSTESTSRKDTVLHFAVKLRQIDYIKEILKLCPSLLLCQNLKGDTALHIAARNGADDIVELLINQAKQRTTRSSHDDIEGGGEIELEATLEVESLIRMVNKKKDTALHEAVRNRNRQLYGGRKEDKYLKVVKVLTEADRQFEYVANNAGETPLYIAAERELFDFVRQILEACPSSEFGGPYGRTALHAAIFCCHQDMVKILLEKMSSSRRQDLIGRADNDERTPLHFAVLYADHPSYEIAEKLLQSDISLAYKADKGGILPVHLAAQAPNPTLFFMFFEHCPDCLEHVDKKGWNALHFAAASRKSAVLLRRVLLSGENELLKGMAKEVDNEGNTLLHVALKSLNLEALDVIIRSGTVDEFAVNNKCLNPIDIIKMHKDQLKHYWNAILKYRDAIIKYRKELPHQYLNLRREKIYEENDEKIQKDQQSQVGSEEDKEINETHLVIATLVATVTFAAGITMPGGYNDKDGTAILATKVAFQAFVILNSLSMTSAIAAVSLHLFATFFPRRVFGGRILPSFSAPLIAVACLEMVAAFMAATFVVLRKSQSLAVSVICICGIFYVWVLVHVFITRFVPIVMASLRTATLFAEWIFRNLHQLAKMVNVTGKKTEKRTLSE